MAAGNSHTNGNGALSLRGWALEAEAAANIAKALAPTAFIPDTLRVWVNPEVRDRSKRELDYEGTVATVTAVLLAGQELGLDPMASLRSFVIIKGTVAMYAVAARALLIHAGHEIIVKESTSTRAVVMARRSGSDIWQTAIWDLDRAKLAGLWPGHPDGNWRKQTKAMLVARASAEAARWVAPDALLGLVAEEVEDAEREEAASAAAAAIESAATGSTAPADDGKAKTTTAKRPAGKRAALPAGPPVPPPTPTEPPPPERPPGPRPNQAQLAKLHAGLNDLQITGREEGLGLVSAWAGRKVDSTGDLTPDELQVVLDRIEALRSIAAHKQPADDDGQADPGPRDEDQPDPPPPESDLEQRPP